MIFRKLTSQYRKHQRASSELLLLLQPSAKSLLEIKSTNGIRYRIKRTRASGKSSALNLIRHQLEDANKSGDDTAADHLEVDPPPWR